MTRGIYARLRHPMYTAAILGSAGLCLLRPTVPVGLAALAVMVFYLIKARHEEELLRRKYPEYADYAARSAGVLPFPRRSRRPGKGPRSRLRPGRRPRP